MKNHGAESIKAVIVSGLILGALCNQAQAVTRYVSSSGSNTIPYTNLAMAGTSIQPVVSYCNPGDTVMVDAGTYVIHAELAITNDITLQSISGPALTIIDATNGNRCISIMGP